MASRAPRQIVPLLPRAGQRFVAVHAIRRVEPGGRKTPLEEDDPGGGEVQREQGAEQRDAGDRVEE